MAAVKTILHVIDSLDKAGAELLFVKYINALPPRYENVVVYLRKPDALVKELHNVQKIYGLDFQNKYSLIKVATQLRRIINAHNVNLIHSHLFWSTLVCRLAKPYQVPLVFSVHTKMSKDAFGQNIMSLWAEKLTYSHRQTALFVSEGAKADYMKYIYVTGDSTILPNFADDAFFREENAVRSFSAKGLKLVAVGHLREQKNYDFLLACMAGLKDQNITLDIYGQGPEYKRLSLYIDQHNLVNVRLMGEVQSPEEVLKNYDAFILAPKYEGFCIAMVEAMAVGLPCVVSDIDVLKEVSGSKQLYFKLEDPKALILQLKQLSGNKGILPELSLQAKMTAAQYRINSYMLRLREVYEQCLQGREHD